ncbi:MAG: hypothetical protein H6928_01705 [Burkholderiaceae bacterium]|nr:hypothetical protein [Burkholderiaceae bacterium]
MTLTELKYIVAVAVRRQGQGAPRSGDRPWSAAVAMALTLAWGGRRE